MPIYNLNNEFYDIPDDVVKDFERDNPTATQKYVDGEDVYEIPVNVRDGFLKQFPKAKLYTEDITQGSSQQDPFEANAERFRNGLPTQKVTTQSVMDANKPPTEIADSEIERLRGIKETAQKQIDNAGFFDRFFDADTRAAVAARNEAEAALETYEEAKHADEGFFDKNVMGVLRGVVDKIGDLSTWDFGASGVASGVALKDVGEKLERGEALSASERNMLDAFGLAAAVNTAYQDKVGMSYKAGQGLPESASFMASLALNPAAGLGRKVAEKAAKAAVKKYGTSMVGKLAKGAARVGGDMAEMAVATAIPGAGRVAEDYYNRLNGHATFDIDENGIIRYGGQVEQEEADTAIWKAFGSQFIENYSESVGNYFAPMGNMLSQLTSKGLKVAHLGKLADVVNDLSSSQFSRGLKRFKDATKFDGFVGEYLEEVAGNFMNAATVGDMNFNSPEDPNSVFNPDVNMRTALSCALMSGTIYAVEAPVSVYNKGKAKLNLHNADKEATRLWGEGWADLRDQMDEADPELLAQLLTGVKNSAELSDEQKGAAMNYAMRLMQFQGYNSRKLQNRMESTDEANAINNAYDEGTDLSIPYDKHSARRAYDRAEAALGEDEAFINEVRAGESNPVAAVNAMAEAGRSDEEIQRAKDYYTSLNRMKGMTDALLDNVNSQIESANKEVDANIWRDANEPDAVKIIPVTLKDGRQGYVKEGIIIPGKEGRIDEGRSDKKVVVRVDGKNWILNPHEDLNNVGQITTPETLKEYNNTVLKQKLINQGIGEIDWNPSTPNPKVGDSFEFNGEPVTIVSHDGKGGMFVVPTEEFQAAANSEQKMQELVAKAQQTQPIPATEYKNWASARLDAQEDAQAMAEEAVVKENFTTENAANGNGMEPVGSEVESSEESINIEDIQPVGVGMFGDIYNQFKGKFKDGVNFLIKKRSGVLQGVFNRREVGDIDLVWGNNKAGLAHIITKHVINHDDFDSVDDAVSVIEDVVNNGEISIQKDGRVAFVKDGYRIAIDRNEEGNWIVTALDTTRKQKEKKRSEQDATRLHQSIFGEENGELVSPQSASLSTNKDSEKNVQSQENEQNFVEMGVEKTLKVLSEQLGDKMPHKVEVTAKAWANDLSKAQQKVEKAQEDLDNAAIGRDAKQRKALEKAEKELADIQREADFWASVDAEVKAAQARRDAILNPQAEIETSEEPMNADELIAQQLASGNIVLDSESFERETGYGSKEKQALNGGAQKLFKAGGMTIEEAGERLMEIDRENGTNFFDQSDSNAGRDALISFLGSVSSRKEINGYIKNSRMAQQESANEALKNEVEQQIMDEYGMTAEEYVEAQERGEVDNTSEESEEVESVDETVSDEWEDPLGEELDEVPFRVAENDSKSRIADVFSEATRIAAQHRKEQVKARAAMWEAAGVKVKVHERISGIHNMAARKAIMDGEIVSGWFDGEVHVYIPHISSLAELDKTIIHEAIAHKGLRELLGEENFDALCDKVWEMMPQSAKDEFIDYPGVKGNTRAAADEYMAHLAENESLSPEEKTLWQKIVQWFKDLFTAKVDNKEKAVAILNQSRLTKNDISDLVKLSYSEYLKNSGRAGESSGDSETRFSAKKKRALETVSTSRKKHQQTVISSADGAKILNNLDNLAEKYENDIHTKEKTFIGEVAKAIEARKQGSGSQYATFETVNGNVVTIRLADHNATVSNFDNRDENEGISIVVSAKDNNGITNDGDAHIVEYFYDSIDLRRADGKPLAEIVKSIKQSLYSGEYKDTTGLAERQEVNDTRFRVAKDKNELVAVHNISEENLRKVLSMGGLIMPSIAITKADMGHEGYGDISLLFDKETINPSDRRNKVYGGDAWTPRFPHLEMKLKSEVVSNIGKKIRGLLDDKLREVYRLSAELYPDNIERNLSNKGVEGYYGEEYMKIAYLLDNGKKFKTPMKLKDYGEMSETILDLAKKKGLKVSEIQQAGLEFYENNPEFVSEIHDIETKEHLKSIPEEKRERVKKLIKDKMPFGHFDMLISQATRMEYDLEHGGLNQIVDKDALKESINKKVKTNNSDYNKWVDELFNGIIEKYGIRNNRDMFTPSGSQRSWEQLHDAATPANVLRYMLAENEQGGSGGFFDSNIMGASAESYESIEEIREKGKKRLKKLEEGEYDEWADSVSSRMSEICNDFLSPSQRNDFGASIDAKIDITNAVAKDKTANGIYKIMKRDYPGFKKEHAAQVEAIVKEIQDFAIGYFEAKPRRIVSLSEVRKAIVPTKTSEDILDALKNNGIEIATYKRGNEETRQRLIKKESEGIRFRISEKSKQIQSEVDKFTSKYNSNPVVLVDSEMTDDELESSLPQSSAERTRKEIGKGIKGAYSPLTKKIYIFADNNSLEEVEDSLFHENLHSLFSGHKMITELYEGLKDGNEEVINDLLKSYKESELPEEMFAFVVAKAMNNGKLDKIRKYLSEESQKELFNTLKDFGYDNREESGRRTGRTVLDGNKAENQGIRTTGGGSPKVDEGNGGKSAVGPRERKERLTELFNNVADMGLQGVLGNKEYDRLMMDIYSVLPKDAREEVTRDTFKHYGTNFVPAVSDYIGAKADGSIMDKVVSIVREALRKVGFDLDLNANEVKYLAWRSKKPLNRNMPLDVAEDIAKQNELGTNGYTRFRSLDKVNEEFNRRLDELNTNKDQKDRVLRLGKPGKFLTDGGVSGSEIEMEFDKFVRKSDDNYVNDHPFTADDIKDLPKAINAPIAVFDSTNHKDKVILTELKKGDNNFIVVIKATQRRRKGGVVLEVNEISTLYPKNAKGIVKWINDGLVTNVDKEKALEWLEALHTHRGTGLINQELDSATKIVESFENPNTGEGNVRFRIKKMKPTNLSDNRDALIKQYDDFLNTGKFNFIEAFQDRMYSAEVLQDLIVETTGKKVRDYEDFLKAENALSSINKEQQKKFIDKFYKPLLEVMCKLTEKYGREAIERYIYCKTGLERNVVLRLRDADKDYEDAKAELDDKLSKGEIDQAQHDLLLQQAEDQRSKALSEDVDYSGLRGLLLNYKAVQIWKDYENDKIDEKTYKAKINQLLANKKVEYKDWKKFAEDQVSAIEGKAEAKELDELWNAINAATQETLRMDYESGMISKETYDSVKNMMKYYVPLRDWMDTTAEEMYEYSDELTRTVSSNQKKAGGRESQADNPIATIALMAQSAIVRGNRNQMKQKFYAFVANRETSLATVRDVWYVKDGNGDWVPQYADTTKANSRAELESIMQNFEANMEALKEQGLAHKGKLPLGMTFKASKRQKMAHVVSVMINGEEHAVYVNGNPRAAQAINGETNSENVDDGYKWIDELKRLYGSGLTSWNPDFIIPNLVRDTIHATTMTMLDKGVWASIKYAWNVPKMFSQVTKEVTGISTGDPKLHAYFEEFVANGGETGYTAIHTLEDYKKEYDKLMNEVKGVKSSFKKGMKMPFEKLATVLEAANRIAEDVNRFNAYVSARESGESIVRSVDAAKNITVNFNKKGALHANSSFYGKVASFMSRWILFFNPSVQGIHQFMTKTRMNKKRAASLSATILASGFLAPMINEILISAFGGDDEDDYWNQSDYKRRNNWMFFTGDGYVSIPLPPVLRELYGMGDIMYGAVTGRIPAGRAGMDMLRQIQSAVGFVNLIPEVSQEPDLVTYAKAFAPDLAAPMLDVISNTDFMGRPIAKWTDFNEYSPEYERVYKGVSPHWVELSKLLNEVGGDEGRRSYFWGNFINPEMMEHLFTSYGGGIGKTLNNLVGMIIDKAEGNDENIDPFRKMPIIPRFYTPNDEKTVVPAINRKFYDYNYQYNVAKNAYRTYRKGVGSKEHPEYQKYLDNMKKSGELEFMNYFESANKRLKKMQTALKNNPSDSELEKRITDLKAEISARSYEILKGE